MLMFFDKIFRQDTAADRLGQKLRINRILADHILQFVSDLARFVRAVLKSGISPHTVSERNGCEALGLMLVLALVCVDPVAEQRINLCLSFHNWGCGI